MLKTTPINSKGLDTADLVLGLVRHV